MPNPPANYHKPTFEALCQRQCTETEIASIFGTDRHVLHRWIKRTYNETPAVVMTRFRNEGKAELRRIGFEIAKKQPSVWIFMAKNHLGMSDNPAPVDTGEQRKEFESAIKAASKALAGCDISDLASIPPRQTAEKAADAGEDDGDE